MTEQFKNYLFVQISRIDKEGNVPIYLFKKPFVVGEEPHVYSLDKTKRANIYSKLKVGSYYVISLDSYQHARGRRWIWVDCIEVPAYEMWIKAFRLWKDNQKHGMQEDKALAHALKDSGITEYTKAAMAAKNRKDLLDGAFEW